MKYLVIDSQNLLFRSWAVNGDEVSVEDRVGLSIHSALFTFKKWIQIFNPDQVVFAFESRTNWRKDWSRSEKSVSHRIYKANRVYDASIVNFYELVDTFKTFIKEFTSVPALSVNECEGDDVIAGFAQMFATGNNSITILSSDRDFIQLYKLPQVSVIDPATGLERKIDKKTGQHIDPHYFLFEKCVRGDGGDGVGSAFPRVRSTRIKKAFDDPYERVNFMNETWSLGDVTYRVGDLFEENKILMDLDAQPDDIKIKLYEGIEAQLQELGTFNFFEYQKFLGKYELLEVGSDSFFPKLFTGKLTENSSILNF